MRRSAWIEGDYRYMLVRAWDFGRGICVFIMLNPSTADGKVDDATIRRCIRFAQDWGYRRLVVVNLFAYRATHPKDLREAMRPTGSMNKQVLLDQARRADLVVCAWGANGDFLDRGRKVARWLRRKGITLHHLGLTKDGHPKHPVRLPADLTPIEWTGS